MAKGLLNRKPNRGGSLFKGIIGIVFAPALVSITRSFYQELTNVNSLTAVSKYFLFGLAAYVFLYIVFFKMDYLYVFGHEFVHAISVWIFGGRVLSFNVRKKSGSITSTKSNIFVDLAPYLVPIYTILIAVVYLIVSSFWGAKLFLKHFIFLLGFSFCFHLVMTVDKMKTKQPDFLRFGYFNSLILIYFVNVFMLSLFFGILFPNFSFGYFLNSFLFNTKELYIGIFDQLF